MTTANDLPSPLIDVLSAESFAQDHLPGAVNFSVYEVAFLEKVRAAFSDLSVPLTVYGFSDTTREAEIAAGKLRSAGYASVAILPGGLESRIAGITPDLTPASEPGQYAVDPEASIIHWTGRNLFNHHAGTVRLGAGSVVIENGCPVRGSFTVDMASIVCTDFLEPAMNQKLIDHLRSDDFFAVDQYPEAKFNLLSADLFDGATLGMPNYRLHGDFTLRGETHPIEFLAVVARKEMGGFVAQAVLDLDRTQWGSIYGSGKFFARLGQHVVNDLIHLQLKLVTASSYSAPAK